MNAESAPNRAIAFFDGQNLFAAARDAFGFTTASYGVPRLAQAIALQHGWNLVQTRFYTGMPDRQESPRLHRHWTLRLRRMRAEGVVVTARPLRRRRRRARLDDGSAVEFTILEEKGIDVRIALDGVRVLLADACDVVILFSQDQDFAELADEVRAIAREQQRWIKIASAYPVGPGTRNARGVEHTDWIPIDRATYEACLETREAR
ncbi:MAG: NYN domain-containing protein [Actinobacteria bacterium]|nr:NYN domain-containing protein [Actinomycetota bacterium]